MSTDKLVLSGDYYIKTPTAGTITFDTGVTTGTVVITGNLDVRGIQTTIESINATIKDNILVLNQGESSAISGGSISLGSAGISIDRGGANDPTKSAQLLWDDTIGWTGATVNRGIWTFKKGGVFSAIDVGTIRFNGNAAGQDKNYILTDQLAPLNVNDDNYTSKIIDRNDIPNKEYVDSKTGNTSTNSLTAREIRVGNSSVTISDYTETRQQSFITASLNSTTTLTIRPTEVLFSTVRIGNSTIESLSSNTDLTLLTNGTGVIAVNNGVSFQAPVFPSWYPPTPAIGKVNVFSSSTVGAGATGLLFNFKNAQGTEFRGELVSAKKAIVLGIIF